MGLGLARLNRRCGVEKIGGEKGRFDLWVYKHVPRAGGFRNRIASHVSLRSGGHRRVCGWILSSSVRISFFIRALMLTAAEIALPGFGSRSHETSSAVSRRALCPNHRQLRLLLFLSISLNSTDISIVAAVDFSPDGDLLPTSTVSASSCIYLLRSLRV